jgi:hypothetical protein
MVIAGSFDPQAIAFILVTHGIDLGVEEDLIATDQVVDEEVELAHMRKLVRIFMRSTVVPDSVLVTKFGRAFSMFESQVLPELLDAGLLIEIPNRGGGSQRLFRLGRPLGPISRMLAAANGSFQLFLRLVRESV